MLISKESLSEWKQQYLRLLVEKCISAYVTLADLAKKSDCSNFHGGLSHLRMATLLWTHLDQPLPYSGEYLTSRVFDPSPLQSYALSIAGDLYFLIVQQWNQLTVPADQELKALDRQLIEILAKVAIVPFPKESFCYPTSLHQALEFSLQNYRLALLTSPSTVIADCRDEIEHTSLIRRLGNVLNELGVFYMSKATGTHTLFCFYVFRCFVYLNDSC